MNDNTGLLTNPYPGLRPFQDDENHLFFGRDEQRTELLSRLRKSRFLAVVGTSGSGKSSLVKAGLLPGLYGGFMAGGASRWRIVDTRPGGDPIGRLATALDATDALGPDDIEAELSFTEASLRRSSLGLVNVVKEARLPKGERVLVLVDQFEELFRFLGTAKSDHAIDDASAFIKLLLAAAKQDDTLIYVVLTMRSDFLGDCARFRGLPEAINDSQYLIPRLTRDQRREAITGPANVSGASLSPTLVNRLLNDVGDTPDQLPILQHALMRTFDYWQTRNPDAKMINLEDYEAVGGMSSAISRHADSLLKGLEEKNGPGLGRRRALIAEKMFKCLTDASQGGRKVRRHAKLEDIARVADASIDEVSAIVNVFRESSNCFLMPPIAEELKCESLVDISHESLIRNWAQLGRWVDEEAESAEQYKLLAQKAALHQRGEEDLLGLQALRVANEWKEKQQPTAAWAERYDSAFDTAMQFLRKSEFKVQAEIDARVGKKRTIRASAISVFFVIVTPLIMVLNFGGESMEYEVEEARYRIQYLEDGEADNTLFHFFNAVIDNARDISADASYVDFNEPYRLARRLEYYEAFDHSSIVSEYDDDYWDYPRGEDLMGAINKNDVPTETLIFAIEKSSESKLTDLPPEPTLYNIIDVLYRGEVEVSPRQLQAELFKTPWGQHEDFLQYIKNYPVLKISDKWLLGIYEQLRDTRFDISELEAIKKISPGADFTKRSDFAKKLIFRMQRNRLRNMLSGPAKDIELSELTGMLEGYRYSIQNTRNEEEEENSVEQIGADTDTDFDYDSAPEDRPSVSLADLSTSELEKKLVVLEKELPALKYKLNNLGDGEDRSQEGINAQNSENRRSISLKLRNISLEQSDISFLWTVKKVIEVLKNPDKEQSLENRLRKITDNKIVANLEPSDDLSFTLWSLADVKLFSDSKTFIGNYWHVTIIILLWPMWALKRRYDAHKEKIRAAKVGLIRLGLGALLDVVVGIIVAAVIVCFVGYTLSLLIAISLNTFDHMDDVIQLTTFILGIPLWICYLLFRDALRFKYNRSVGKIIFELLPVTIGGGEINKRISLKRNWLVFPGILLAAGGSVFIVSTAFEFLNSTTLESDTIVFILMSVTTIVVLAALGWFEKLGSIRSRTRVIDSRSVEAITGSGIKTE